MHKGKSVKKRILIFLLSILLANAVLFGYLSKSLEKAVVEYARADAYNIVVKSINDVVYNYLDKGEVEYTDFTTLEKDTNGKVTAIIVNSVKLNIVKSKISKEIIDNLSTLENQNYGIPIGTVLGSRLFSGRGFKIHIKIIPLGSFTSSIDNKFNSTGINQSIHSIYLNFNAVITVVAPFSEASVSVTDKICIAETVLLGDVPDTYVQFKGSDGNDYLKYFNSGE